MSNNNVEIVVARYNEDLKWTLEYPFNMFKYIVYNKGINDNFEKAHVKHIFNLPNVGKCDHTYLYHIIENYENLKNVVVFFPGSLQMVKKKGIAMRILINIIKSNYNNAYFIGNYQQSVKNTFNNFKLDEWVTSCQENRIINQHAKLQLCKLRPYGKWYNYFFGVAPAKWSTYLGIFAIDKRDIIQHPAHRYKMLLDTVSRSANPEAGHYIERSWGAIFYPLRYTIKQLSHK